MMRFARVAFAILICFLAIPLSANQETGRSSHNSAHGLTVSLALDNTEFSVGESIPARIQISNSGVPGDESLLIANYIFEGSGGLPVSRIEFDLTNDKGHAIRSTWAMISDWFSSEKHPNPATAFLNSYMLLHPGYSLSTQFRIRPESYGGLKPGYYRLWGTYTSNGLFYPPVYNQVGLREGDVKSVPFKAWRGKIPTNEVRFRIRPADTTRKH